MADSHFGRFLLENFHRNNFQIKYPTVDRLPYYYQSSELTLEGEETDTLFIVRQQKDIKLLEPYFKRYLCERDRVISAYGELEGTDDNMLRYSFRCGAVDYSVVTSAVLGGIDVSEEYKHIVKLAFVRYINLLQRYKPKHIVSCHYPSIDMGVLRYLCDIYDIQMIHMSHGFTAKHPFHTALPGHKNILFSKLSEEIASEYAEYDGELITVKNPYMPGYSYMQPDGDSILLLSSVVPISPYYKELSLMFEEIADVLQQTGKKVFVKPHINDDEAFLEKLRSEFGFTVYRKEENLGDIIQECRPAVAVVCNSSVIFEIFMHGIPVVIYDNMCMLENIFPLLRGVVETHVDSLALLEALQHEQSAIPVDYFIQMNRGLPAIEEALSNILLD